MHLDPWVETTLSIALITVVAAAAHYAVRRGIHAGVSRLLERRAGEPELTAAARAGLEQRAVTLRQLAVRISGVIIIAIAGLMVLDKLGIEIAPALAGLGVVGIAVGFGAQAIFHDWLAGIFIIAEHQYSIGDVVKVAGVTGVVEDISLRRTVLRDLNGTLHSVPNGQIGVASNLTSEWAQVNLDVPVAYDSDIPKVTEVLNRTGQDLQADPAWAAKLVEPPSVLRVEDLGDSAVSLKMLGKVHAGDQWAVTGELRRRILATFRAEGIEIPFPQRVVTTRSLAGAGESSGADS